MKFFGVILVLFIFNHCVTSWSDDDDDGSNKGRRVGDDIDPVEDFNFDDSVDGTKHKDVPPVQQAVPPTQANVDPNATQPVPAPTPPTAPATPPTAPAPPVVPAITIPITATGPLGTLLTSLNTGPVPPVIVAVNSGVTNIDQIAGTLAQLTPASASTDLNNFSLAFTSAYDAMVQSLASITNTADVSLIPYINALNSAITNMKNSLHDLLQTAISSAALPITTSVVQQTEVSVLEVAYNIQALITAVSNLTQATGITANHVTAATVALCGFLEIIFDAVDGVNKVIPLLRGHSSQQISSVVGIISSTLSNLISSLSGLPGLYNGSTDTPTFVGQFNPTFSGNVNTFSSNYANILGATNNVLELAVTATKTAVSRIDEITMKFVGTTATTATSDLVAINTSLNFALGSINFAITVVADTAPSTLIDSTNAFITATGAVQVSAQNLMQTVSSGISGTFTQDTITSIEQFALKLDSSFQLLVTAVYKLSIDAASIPTQDVLKLVGAIGKIYESFLHLLFSLVSGIDKLIELFSRTESQVFAIQVSSLKRSLPLATAVNGITRITSTLSTMTAATSAASVFSNLNRAAKDAFELIIHTLPDIVSSAPHALVGPAATVSASLKALEASNEQLLITGISLSVSAFTSAAIDKIQFAVLIVVSALEKLATAVADVVKASALAASIDGAIFVLHMRGLLTNTYQVVFYILSSISRFTDTLSGTTNHLLSGAASAALAAFTDLSVQFGGIAEFKDNGSVALNELKNPIEKSVATLKTRLAGIRKTAGNIMAPFTIATAISAINIVGNTLLDATPATANLIVSNFNSLITSSLELLEKVLESNSNSVPPNLPGASTRVYVAYEPVKAAAAQLLQLALTATKAPVTPTIIQNIENSAIAMWSKIEYLIAVGYNIIGEAIPNLTVADANFLAVLRSILGNIIQVYSITVTGLNAIFNNLAGYDSSILNSIASLSVASSTLNNLNSGVSSAAATLETANQDNLASILNSLSAAFSSTFATIINTQTSVDAKFPIKLKAIAGTVDSSLLNVQATAESLLNAVISVTGNALTPTSSKVVNIAAIRVATAIEELNSAIYNVAKKAHSEATFPAVSSIIALQGVVLASNEAVLYIVYSATHLMGKLEGVQEEGISNIATALLNALKGTTKNLNESPKQLTSGTALTTALVTLTDSFNSVASMLAAKVSSTTKVVGNVDESVVMNIANILNVLAKGPLQKYTTVLTSAVSSLSIPALSLSTATSDTTYSLLDSLNIALGNSLDNVLQVLTKIIVGVPPSLANIAGEVSKAYKDVQTNTQELLTAFINYTNDALTAKVLTSIRNLVLRVATGFHKLIFEILKLAHEAEKSATTPVAEFVSDIIVWFIAVLQIVFRTLVGLSDLLTLLTGSKDETIGRVNDAFSNLLTGTSIILSGVPPLLVGSKFVISAILTRLNLNYDKLMVTFRNVIGGITKGIKTNALLSTLESGSITSLSEKLATAVSRVSGELANLQQSGVTAFTAGPILKSLTTLVSEAFDIIIKSVPTLDKTFAVNGPAQSLSAKLTRILQIVKADTVTLLQAVIAGAAANMSPVSVQKIKNLVGKLPESVQVLINDIGEVAEAASVVISERIAQFGASLSVLLTNAMQIVTIVVLGIIEFIKNITLIVHHDMAAVGTSLSEALSKEQALSVFVVMLTAFDKNNS